ncbi:hypothetical protein BY458DRAFT_158886 [Sporodiniella umbellata]|nr:hypothetical protein BY458DRAFT_158886 [Sporodiniella umbellata]
MSYLPNLRSRTARNSLASNYNATEEATASSRTLSKLVECFLSFGSHQSKEATEFKADLLEHYLQILSSQKESSVIPDEHSIINNIHDHFKTQIPQKKRSNLRTFTTNYPQLVK